MVYCVKTSYLFVVVFAANAPLMIHQSVMAFNYLMLIILDNHMLSEYPSPGIH